MEGVLVKMDFLMWLQCVTPSASLCALLCCQCINQTTDYFPPSGQNSYFLSTETIREKGKRARVLQQKYEVSPIKYYVVLIQYVEPRFEIYYLEKGTELID